MSEPTWRTPIESPLQTSGTPSSDLIPFSRRRGLSTSAWSTSERDAHPLLDLLLEADGGPCDQLLPVGVEQEDRAGVRLEDLANPREQNLEQILELEVRQRCIGDRLNVLDPGSRRELGLVQARVLDRDRSPVGHELQKLDVAVVEAPWRNRADVQDAEDPGLHHQRDAEQRPNVILAEDRVEHVGVVDVVEDDGPLLRGHPAREALADGDAGARVQAGLEPIRGARDELVPLVVEQKHRARVDLERFTSAREEGGQQVVEPQVRERRVSELLEAR